MNDSKNKQPGLRVRRVLIIDDNPDIFNDFKSILEGLIDHSNLDAFNRELFGNDTLKEMPENTYDLHYANQGQLGFEKVKAAKEERNPFHLAFVDMRMPPGWDGMETIRHLWQVDPQLHVVICTAYSDHSWQEITLKLGRTDKLLFLKKPFDSVEVSQITAAMTEKWFLYRQAALKMEEMEQLVEQRTKQLEAANLRELQVQKQESLNVLAGSIAHNFNNLLAVVLGNLELVSQALPQESPIINKLKQTEEAAKNAAALSTAMLTYTGQWRGNVKTIDLSASITEMRLLLNVTVPKHISCTYHLPKTLPGISGNPGQVRQILMNLISNAIEAIGNPQGKISIHAYLVKCDESFFENCLMAEQPKAGNYVCCEVTDNGCGMGDEVKRKIFDPYYTTKFTGRGMGMAAVLGIVKVHQGAIYISSQPQMGTTVKIYFPALTDSQQETVVPEGNQDKLVWKGEGTILLADDEPMVLEMAKVILKQLGFKVVTAENGEEAVQFFKQYLQDKTAIDLVMLDVSMPGISGLEAFEQIRNIKADVPAIIFSGFSHQQLDPKLAPFNDVEFLQKPFSVMQLKTILSTLLPN